MAGERLEGEEKLMILGVFLLTWSDLFENDEVERGFFFFLFFFFLKILLVCFWLRRVLLLRRLLPGCGEQGLLSSCGVRVSCSGSSC